MSLNFLDKSYFLDALHPFLDKTTTRPDSVGRERIFADQQGNKILFDFIDPKLSFNLRGLEIFPCKVGSIKEAITNFKEQMLVLLGFSFPKSDTVENLRNVYFTYGPEHLIKSVFPYSSIQKIGDIFIIEIDKRNPIFIEQTSDVPTYGLQNIDRRSEYEQESLLTQERRGRLEKCGRIVYEGDPQGKDRLLVCVKHLHGYTHTFPWLEGLDKHGAMQFRGHQQEIEDLIACELDSTDNPLLFLETFPRNDQSAEGAENQTLLFESYTLFQNLRRYRKSDTPEIRFALETFDSILRDKIGYLSVKHARQGLVQGDGRYDLNADFDAIDVQTRYYEELARQRKLTAAELQAYDAVCQKNFKMSIRDSNRVVAIEVAKVLQRNQLGFMIYGAKHFTSGFSSRREHSLEEYLELIPGVQVVVVEPHGYKSLSQRLIFGKTFEDTRTAKQSPSVTHEQIEALIASMKTAVLAQNFQLFEEIAKELYELYQGLSHSYFISTPEQPKPQEKLAVPLPTAVTTGNECASNLQLNLVTGNNPLNINEFSSSSSPLIEVEGLPLTIKMHFSLENGDENPLNKL